MISSPGSGIKQLGPLVGAIDQGSGSTRFTVFVAETGELVTYHQVPVQTETLHPGWLEVHPEDIINSVVQCIDATIENLKQLDINPSDVVAIGLASQRATAFAWDKLTGYSIYSGGILAADLRTQEMVKQLKKSRLLSCEGVRTISGLPISTYFSAIKFKWLLENNDEVKAALRENRLLIGTTDSYLMWKLTGGRDGGLHITDVTNASLTGLMNLETLMWDKSLCEYFGVPIEILPKIRSCSEVFGTLTISQLKGLPVSGCIGDQQAALIGQNCFRPGQAKTTFGNGAFTLFNVGPKIVYSEEGLLSTVAYKLGESQPTIYALEGSVKEAGSLMTWLISLGILASTNDILKDPSHLDYNNGVIMVPSSTGFLAPHWRQDSNGLLIGITTGRPNISTKQHICQAALEAVAFQNRDILEAMQKDSKIRLSTLLADGGMSQNNLMMQVQADFLGIPVLRPSMPETTALGAAIVAGMAKGVDVWKAQGTVDLTMDRFLPKLTDNQRDVRYEQWKTALKNSFNWVDTAASSRAISPPINTDNTYRLTNHERLLRASVSPAIFFWTSFLLWKISHSFCSDR